MMPHGSIDRLMNALLDASTRISVVPSAGHTPLPKRIEFICVLGLCAYSACKKGGFQTLNVHSPTYARGSDYVGFFLQWRYFVAIFDIRIRTIISRITESSILFLFKKFNRLSTHDKKQYNEHSERRQGFKAYSTHTHRCVKL